MRQSREKLREKVEFGMKATAPAAGSFKAGVLYSKKERIIYTGE